jgi:protein AroM
MIMSGMMLGTLTIGQAPRSDIVPILEAHLPPGTACLHLGALDGLSKPEIAARFTPRSGEAVLTTRLLDGSPVVLGKPAVRDMLQAKLATLEAKGCDLIALLCTGEFADLNCRRARLIEPDRLVPPVVAVLAGQDQIGVVVPLAAQVKSEAEKFKPFARPALFAVASPYAEGPDSLAAAAHELRDAGAKLVLLDCMGFTECHRQAARAACGLPVVLSNSLIARLLAEIV